MSLRYLLAGPWLAAHRLLRAIAAAGDGGVRFLMFHDVPAAEMAAFESLVAWLAATGRLASPDEAEDILNGGRIAGRAMRCVCTFDDGFASNRAAAAVLERHGARGMFFVCPGLIDMPEPARAEAIAANVFRGLRQAGGLALMGWDEVAALHAAGHVIGSHSLLHRRLTALSGEDLETDIAQAAEILSGRLGRRPDWFAYTFGDIASVDERVLRTVGRHHRYCRSGIRGLNDGATPALALRGDHVDLLGPPAYRHLVIEGGLDRRYGPARQTLDRLAAATPP